MTVSDSKLFEGVRVISAHPQADDDTLVAILEKHGFDIINAELLAGFAPLVLGRLLLEKVPVCASLGLSKTLVVQDVETAKRVEFELEAIKMFKHLKRVVAHALEGKQLSSEQLLAVALRSAEVKVVNTLLGMKKSLDGFVGAPAVMLRLKLEWIRNEPTRQP